MSAYKTLKQIVLDARHMYTGGTVHKSDGEVLPPAVSLKIVAFSANRRFYLLYLDAAGREMTDTFHETIEQAMDQAKFEYQVEPTHWIDIDSRH